MVITPEKPFSSPEEEIKWLRDQLEVKTKAHKETLPPHEYKEHFRRVLQEVTEEAHSHIAGPYALSDTDASQKSNALADEPHHVQINALLAIAREKGVLSALKVARALGNPHLLDDFHDRLIVELFAADAQSLF